MLAITYPSVLLYRWLEDQEDDDHHSFHLKPLRLFVQDGLAIDSVSMKNMLSCTLRNIWEKMKKHNLQGLSGYLQSLFFPGESR